MTEPSVERLGGFRILEALKDGSGSQGNLYRAVCETPPFPEVAVGDVVALKTMPDPDDGATFARLQRRTASLAAIRHPNVVRYFGCFAVSDAFSSVHVVVMECLQGRTLKEWLHESPDGLDVDVAVQIVKGMVAGLEATSAVGIVHRDVKPANVFICDDGSVKMIDYEIARQEDGTLSTGSGRFFGTFDYMAPEFTDARFRGDEVSDVFSAGVVLHEALSGRTPYAAASKSNARADFDFVSRWTSGGSAEGKSPLSVSARAYCLMAGMKDVIGQAINPERSKRFKDFTTFRTALNAVGFREIANGANRYRLLKVVGKGGFGEVFKARMAGTNRLVAVKRLLKANYGDRFRREARTMMRFRDPCFTQFVDFFEINNKGVPESYLVMEFLSGMPGSSLRDAIRRGTLPGNEVLRAFARYAHGLAVMHAGGVYHRDIKPANLYYPVGRPDDAVIMDFGIVRDVNGTVTFQQVPGTLDYMPPEIVTVGSRGDGRMDIYALGLCLYEALTGKSGYPRLPRNGSFEAFYKRATSREPPKFDDEEVERRPEVMRLLRRMTDCDPARRLGNAAELERELLSIDWNAQPRGQVRPSRTSGQYVPTPPDDEPDTVETADAPPAPAPRPRPTRNRPIVHSAPRPRPIRTEPLIPPDVLKASLKFAGLSVAVLAVILGCYLVWPSVAAGGRRISTGITEYREKRAKEEADRIENERRRKEELARKQEEDRKEQARLEAERKHREAVAARTKTAADAADAVIERYDNDSDLTEADKIRKSWIAAWNDKELVGGFFTTKTNAFAEARASAEKRIKNANDAAAEADERRRRVSELMKNARSESEPVIAAYDDESVSFAHANSKFADWRIKWAKSLANVSAFAELEKSLNDARDRRIAKDNEKQVLKDCRELFESIHTTTTSDNVSKWRDCLTRAENLVRRALGEQRIGYSNARTLRDEISKVRQWTVGVVENKSHETLEFLGKKIPPVDDPLNCVTFVFTNGFPAEAAITVPGHESIRLSRDRFDAKRFIVMPRDLRRTVGSAELEIPSLAKGVVCLVDGVPYGSGVAKIRAGRHTCTYRNTAMVADGVRTFRDQEQIVDVAEGSRSKLRGPSAWIETDESKSARESAACAEESERIAAQLDELMALLPIETRRSRLERAWRILNDHRTAPCLGQSGLDKWKQRYAVEHAKVAGYVENEMDEPAKVDGDGRTVQVAPHGRELIVYARGKPESASVRVAGYENVRLPEAFDGSTFYVSPEILKPLPVEVSVPRIGGDVGVRISGKNVEGSVGLLPGRYTCIYSRKGFADQRIPFEVKVNAPMEIPPPGAWKETGAFGSFMDSVRDASDATSRGFGAAYDAIVTIERKDGKQ